MTYRGIAVQVMFFDHPCSIESSDRSRWTRNVSESGGSEESGHFVCQERFRCTMLESERESQSAKLGCIRQVEVVHPVSKYSTSSSVNTFSTA